MGFNDYGFYNGFDRESKLLHLSHKAITPRVQTTQ